GYVWNQSTLPNKRVTRVTHGLLLGHPRRLQLIGFYLDSGIANWSKLLTCRQLVKLMFVYVEHGKINHPKHLDVFPRSALLTTKEKHFALIEFSSNINIVLYMASGVDTLNSQSYKSHMEPWSLTVHPRFKCTPGTSKSRVISRARGYD
ncbi:hypothetical protein M8C21_022741, partial [Ambrosia artemisiifolia]